MGPELVLVLALQRARSGQVRREQQEQAEAEEAWAFPLESNAQIPWSPIHFRQEQLEQVCFPYQMGLDHFS